ncbi:hypothetical protein HRbin23_00399 [bacterium HR23]|nr:hypothetical protein HRbin23_00399 [bacterium HR23]
MKQVSIYEAKTHLSRLIEAVCGGEEVVLMRAGRPVARLVPVSGKPRVLGVLRGRLEVPEDFDAPLDEETLGQFEETR